MILFKTTPNVEAVLYQYLQLLNLSVTRQAIADELDRHPDYPNLLALNDVLRHFGAPVDAYQIQTNDLTKVPQPFIAHTSKPASEFMLVKKIDAQNITLADQKNSNQVMPLADFYNLFTGVVLAAEEDQLAIKPRQAPGKLSFDTYRPIIGIVLLAVCLVSGVGLTMASVNNWQWQITALSIFKTAGLLTSILLLIQSINKNNPLIQTLCGGSKTNCNAILSSKAANVFEGLSWSEVGFFYFAGTWLVLLLTGAAPQAVKIISWLNLISLPYTIYSIYFQARVARQWCVLCCTVQALLWLEFASTSSFITAPAPALDIKLALTILCGLLAPIALWFLIKPLLLKIQQVAPLKQQLRKFKYNADLFEKLLHAQPRYASPAEDWSIVLGNVEAGYVITMVSNPYCQPCAAAHEKLDQWLSTNPDMQLRIIFSVKNTDSDLRTPVARHLMALNNLEDKTIVKQALHNWYNRKQKSYAQWAEAYPVQVEPANIKQLDKQITWCEMAEINATPTILINGHRLPEAYLLHDIKYLLQ